MSGTRVILAALVLPRLLSWAADPTPLEMAYAHLRPLAGSSATDCGHVGLHENPEKSKSCAQDAVKSIHPFFVAYDDTGIDSLIMCGLASDGHGRAWRVTYDSAGWNTICPKGQH